MLVYGFFFFNDTATTEIYTLSLHDALPIFVAQPVAVAAPLDGRRVPVRLLVLGEQPVLDLARPDVPGRLRVVHQWRVAAPAVRVAVLVALLAEQDAALLQVLDQRRVGDLEEVAPH